jgi:L-ascorbate metabolism protein UlaG (beta-lactamase superfamily)
LQELYIKNPNLPTILDGYSGDKIIKNRFTNEYDAAKNNSFLRVLKWKLFCKNPQQLEAAQDTSQIGILPIDVLSKNIDKLIWLGHASFIIDINGTRILLDPCLTQPPTIKRKTELPCSIDKIKPDLVLISHGHYDHFDTKTIEALQCDSAKILMPLKLSSYVKNRAFYKNIIEMGWYQKFIFNNIEILFLPAYHWHSRYGYDKNRALWGSFVMRYKGKQIYFCGDSGYNTHFAKIREVCGDMDICLLPVGAYKPDFIMKHSHMNPYESIKAFKDLGGKTFVPMHYGTFTLSWEPPNEGVQIVQDAAKNGLLSGELKELKIGEVMTII